MGTFYWVAGITLALSVVALAAVVTDEAWAMVTGRCDSLADAIDEWIGDVITAIRSWWGVAGRHVAMGAYTPRHGVTA